jgi:hypothetical protein
LSKKGIYEPFIERSVGDGKPLFGSRRIREHLVCPLLLTDENYRKNAGELAVEFSRYCAGSRFSELVAKALTTAPTVITELY